jgi:predicted secreted protein
MATKKTKTQESYQPESFAETFSKLTDSPQTGEKQTALIVKPKTGRPSKYTKEIAQSICEQLSEGIPLREICRQDGMPAWRTIYDWMYKDEALSAAIAHARDLGYDSLAEECLDIADDANNDWMERIDKEGRSTGWIVNGEHVQRSKLRIETRLKLLAKFNPKKYGESMTHKGDAENPLEVGTTMLDAFVQKLELKAQAANAE